MTQNTVLFIRMPARTAAATHLTGTVRRGDQRGRTLGFPTANIHLAPDSPLDDGVFAGNARLADGRAFGAAVSIGRRTTFYTDGAAVRLLEAHLLDFDEDLYGRLLTVELLVKLRDQRRFDGVDALRAQLIDDVERCVAIRSGEAPTHGRMGRPRSEPDS